MSHLRVKIHSRSCTVDGTEFWHPRKDPPQADIDTTNINMTLLEDTIAILNDRIEKIERDLEVLSPFFDDLVLTRADCFRRLFSEATLSLILRQGWLGSPAGT